MFDDGADCYWYRTNAAGFRVGMKVIVPISGIGLWKIGTITETRTVTEDDAPYPVLKTKGIVAKAGLFSESKVKSHNDKIKKSKYNPIDISVAEIKTRRGTVKYCTCARERELERKLIDMYKEPFILIENYPVSKESDIPREALKRLNDRLNKIKKMQEKHEYGFMELMDDLDQYN